MIETLFEAELARHGWDHLRQGSADWRQDIPGILRELTISECEDAASASYCRLEGTCFPQRLVTESCVAVVPCLLAALADGLGGPARGWVVEALRGIVGGEPIHTEVAVGNSSVVHDCIDTARAGLWLLLSLREQLAAADLANLHEVLAVLDAERASG